MAACLHGLFTANALEHLKVCDDVVSTDTVPSPVSKISVAEDFAAAIKADR
jgi:phosphoribosylpyrophosphate synthetase